MKRTAKALFVLLCISLSLCGCQCKHEWKPATCEEPSVCIKCGETTGEAIGHKWKEATCTEPKKCEICGSVSGEPLGHQVVNATCTDPAICDVCHDIISPALGHQVDEFTVITEATCTSLGSKSGICKECGETITRDIPKIDHVIGEWEIETPATISKSGKRIQKCTVCGHTVNSESYSLSEEEYPQAYRAECEAYSYDTIARSPDTYYGEYARFTGEVIQVMQDTALGNTTYTLRVNVTQTGKYSIYYTDTILVYYQAKSSDQRILEDDIVTLYGELKGEYTYETIFGASVTIPLLNAKYVDIN